MHQCSGPANPSAIVPHGFPSKYSVKVPPLSKSSSNPTRSPAFSFRSMELFTKLPLLELQNKYQKGLDQALERVFRFYDEASGEWIAPGEAVAAAGEEGIEVRDAVGNLLADGDQVTLIKDLKVKGAGQTLKRGTLIKSIRLTGDAQEIDCRYDGIKGLVLRAEFVRKR